MRTRAALVMCAVISVPARAIAGRTYYGALHGTEVQAERNVEITSWVYEDNEDDASETRWGVGPLIGFDDRIELGFPLELAKAGTGTTELDRYGAELRYRLVTQDPEQAPPFAPLIRVGVNRIVADHQALNIQVDLVMSYQSGRLHVLADAGVSANLGKRTSIWELYPGAGASIRVIGELRCGVEVFGELPLGGDDDTSLARSAVGTQESESGWLAVGPNVAWTHGRFWLSASNGIGIVGIRNAPRLQWGIAF